MTSARDVVIVTAVSVALAIAGWIVRYSILRSAGLNPVFAREQWTTCVGAA